MELLLIVYYNPLSTIIKPINVIHSPSETLYYRGAFAHVLVYERETTTFLTTNNLNDILNAISLIERTMYI